MKLLKNAAVATTLALSLGTVSTTANAVCMGMACMYAKMTPLQGINATIIQIDAAIEAVDAHHSDQAIIGNIKDALRVSKEINANDKVDRNRQRANGYLKKARKAIKQDDFETAKVELKEARTRFEGLKGMLNLTQADRASQQTHMLNRLTNTKDDAAGAKSH
ncbi:hypothetical protein [Methyloprofundus sp.]|uniref:hypothetical protein n=1 Tax=Methyloprofundus sp. TaxID=2020875 RepID=UPI003D135847